MNLHMCAKFGPDRTTGDDVYTVGRIHTHTHTHTLSYIDIDIDIDDSRLSRGVAHVYIVLPKFDNVNGEMSMSYR